MNGNAYNPSQVWMNYQQATIRDYDSSGRILAQNSSETFTLRGNAYTGELYVPNGRETYWTQGEVCTMELYTTDDGDWYYDVESVSVMEGSGTGYQSEMYTYRDGKYYSRGYGTWYMCTKKKYYNVIGTYYRYIRHPLPDGTALYYQGERVQRSAYTPYTGSKLYYNGGNIVYTPASAEPRIYTPSQGGTASINPAAFTTQKMTVLSV